MKSDSKKSSSAQFDEQEPKAALTAAPVFLFIVLALLLYWGVLYLDENAGGFSKLVYAPYKSEKQLPKVGGLDTDKGRKVYAASCSPCHQANGNGLAGQFPPLAGSEWVVTPSAGRSIRIVLDGMTGPVEVKGQQYNNTMVPWRDNLSDEDIAAVLTYIRSEWGNKAAPVTAEHVKAVRGETAGRSGAWTAPELLKVPEKE